VNEYLEKGSLLFIEGRLQSRNRQDNEGQIQRPFEIVPSDLLMLNSHHLPHQMDDQEEIYNYLF
jgi:single-stranded DNA-binding protein